MNTKAVIGGVILGALINTAYSSYQLHKKNVKIAELAAFIESEDLPVIGFITCYHHTGPYTCGYLRDKKQKP